MPEFLLPLAGSIIAGGLIGFEREFRGRPAGFRTHILVSLASCLLMLAAVNQEAWTFTGLSDETIVTDPTRMAHGILTGIGFLCAGVIFREGFSIHGLTTAASLWITSALGVLYGVGMDGLATGGTVVTLLVLVALRVVDERLPVPVLIDLTVSYDRNDGLAAEALADVLRELGLSATVAGARLREDGRLVEQALKLRGRGERPAEALGRRLAELPQVRAFNVAPRED